MAQKPNCEPRSVINVPDRVPSNEEIVAAQASFVTKNTATRGAAIVQSAA
jgi:hypothetical protein